jgi:flagellar motor component MotA
MKKSIIYYVLGVIAAVIAVIIFMKSFDWKSVLILLFGIASACY